MSVDLSDNDSLAEHFKFLDGLRATGAVNMFSAAPLLEEEYGMARNEARAVLAAWQTTFDGESSAQHRAERAMTAQ